MGYNFDGPNRKIRLTAGTTDFSVQDLWSRWVDWYLTSDNSKYLPAIRNVGGDQTSATKSQGIAYFLLNNWRIVPQAADHRLIIDGDLYTDPFGDRPVDLVPGYTIVVEYSVSNLISIVNAGAVDQVPDAVFAEEVLPGMPFKTALRALLAVTAGLARGFTGGTADEWIEYLEMLSANDGLVRVRALVDKYGNRKQIEIDKTE